MKCPICGKELELKNKQIGANENGDPIFNEYAICRDCRKQWNLDKQRAKKAAAKKPVKQRPVQNTGADNPDEKRYSNIPPEKVRTKHEKAARKSYEDMLATGTIGKPVKKKKSQEAEETRTIAKSPSAEVDRKNTSAKPSTKKPEYDDYDDDDYYEDTPMFGVMRIILGIISLVGFGYFIYRGFTTGMSSATDNGAAGMTFVILALCLLVSALLYFITIRTNSIFAFLLPMIFYLGSAVFAFLRRGDDLQLFVAAVVAAVLAVVSLSLAITSRDGDDYDDYDDYDDAFEDDYADE